MQGVADLATLMDSPIVLRDMKLADLETAIELSQEIAQDKA